MDFSGRGRFVSNRVESTKEVRISTGYIPRDWQQRCHRSLKRFNVLVFHRRGGKSVFSINEMLDKGVRNQHHNPQYAYIAPTYKQAKMIAWEYLKDYTKNLPGRDVNKQELTVTINRPDDHIKYMLLGADNPDSLRGIYLDGAILDEYAQQDPSIWGEIVLPTLADRKGWAIFIGTPKGQNHFYDIYQKARNDESGAWFSILVKSSESGILSGEELRLQRSAMQESDYLQEFECSFQAAMKGSYYGEIISQMYAETPPRIGRYICNPLFPVDTFWDIGVSDDCSIVFRQKVGSTYYYIDFYSCHGVGLPHYAEVLRHKGYRYGRHVWPHDGMVKEFGTGTTRVEQAKELLGVAPEIQKKFAIADRIQATRNRLAQSFIDEMRCGKLIDCLKNYEREWDPINRVFRATPKHTWASHGADSFGYSALDTMDSHFLGVRKKELHKHAVMDYNEF